MLKLKELFTKGWVIAKRSVHIQIKQHALGYAWNLIIPVMYAFFYVTIKREISGSNSEVLILDWDVVRTFSGILLFQVWMQTLLDTASMVRRNKGLLTGLNVPYAPFVIAIGLESFLNFLIRSLLIVLAVIVIGLLLSLTIQMVLWFLLSILALLLSALAIGLFLSPWTILYPDVQKALRAVNLPLMLVSPIFYAATTNSDSLLYIVNLINPLASPLAVIVDALQGQASPFYASSLLIWFVLSVFLIILGLSQLKTNVPILLERMGS